MLTLVLAFSVVLGVLSMGVMWGLDKTNSTESNIIRDLKELECVLLRTLIIHQEQILYLEQQKIRLEEKSNAELVSKYAEDILLLSEYSEEIAKEVQMVWQHRILEEYQSDYAYILRLFPHVDSLHLQSSKKEYEKMIQELNQYAHIVEKKTKEISFHILKLPANIYSSAVMEVILQAKERTLVKYQILAHKTDNLIDQLQYVCDAMDIRRIHDENTQREPIKEILADFSAYLESTDHLFEEHDFDIHVNTQIRDVASISSDMQSELSAQREVEQYLRTKLKKKYNKEVN